VYRRLFDWCSQKIIIAITPIPTGIQAESGIGLPYPENTRSQQGGLKLMSISTSPK